MSQLDDIIRVFGQVDQILLSGADENHDAVAALLPHYDRRLGNEESALGWYGEINTWLASTMEDPPADLFPSLEQALANLAGEQPEGTLATRRILGLAALIRADPTSFAPGQERAGLVRDALRPLVPGGDDLEARLDQFHQLLADRGGSLGAIGRWSQFIEDVLNRNLLVEAFALRFPPCYGDDVLIDPGPGERRVLSLVTDFTTAELTLEEVAPFLEPGNWPLCSAFWCRMEEAKSDALTPYRRFVEEVGSDCRTPGSWRLRTCLDVSTRQRPGAIAVGYRRSQDQGNEGDGRIEVDEGCIVAQKVDTGLRIRTVKRLRFTGLDLSRKFSLAMCVFGWSSTGQDMAFSCAGKKQPGKPLQPDPVLPGAVVAAFAEATIGFVQDVAAITSSALATCSTAFSKSVTRLAGGTYEGRHFIRDATDTVQRAADDASRVVAAGSRAMSVAMTAGSTAGPASAYQGAAAPNAGGGVNAPAGVSGTRYLETEIFAAPGTDPGHTLLLTGSALVGDFGNEVPAVPLKVGQGDEFKLYCTVAPTCCGAYWGEVTVSDGTTVGAPVFVELIVG